MSGSFVTCSIKQYHTRSLLPSLAYVKLIGRGMYDCKDFKFRLVCDMMNLS